MTHRPPPPAIFIIRNQINLSKLVTWPIKSRQFLNMPPQIKHDLNRAGWETTDFPSVCENCLPENPYVQMIKEDHGAECKIVSHPYTQTPKSKS